MISGGPYDDTPAMRLFFRNSSRSCSTTLLRLREASKVFNWQIGREMDYRFDNGPAKRQFAAVFNINRCIACQTCSMACKSHLDLLQGQELMWWNNVETKPYGGYPATGTSTSWQLRRSRQPRRPGRGTPRRRTPKTKPLGHVRGQDDLRDGADGVDRTWRTGYLPAEADWKHPNIHEDTATGVQSGGASLPQARHGFWFFHLSASATTARTRPASPPAPQRDLQAAEDGIVLIDQGRCRGYRKCVEAARTRSPCTGGTTRTSREVRRLLPADRGQATPHRRAAMRDALHVSLRRQDPAPGPRAGGRDGEWTPDRQNPLYYLIT